jgi:hypothetical protein
MDLGKVVVDNFDELDHIALMGLVLGNDARDPVDILLSGGVRTVEECLLEVSENGGVERVSNHWG